MTQAATVAADGGNDQGARDALDAPFPDRGHRAGPRAWSRLVSAENTLSRVGTASPPNAASARAAVAHFFY